MRIKCKVDTQKHTQWTHSVSSTTAGSTGTYIERVEILRVLMRVLTLQKLILRSEEAGQEEIMEEAAGKASWVEYTTVILARRRTWPTQPVPIGVTLPPPRQYGGDGDI